MEVATAERRAAALTLPAEVTTEGSVTGPAAELAGMLKSYVRLTQRGWQYLATALGAGSGIAVRMQKPTSTRRRGARGSAAPRPRGPGRGRVAQRLHGAPHRLHGAPG